MTPAALWTVIIGMALLTFALRLSMILLFGRVMMPAVIRQALRFVPPAVLSAFVLPELVMTGGTLNISVGNVRLIAGILAALVAWRTRNVFLTIGAGMAALWILQVMR